MKQRTRLIYFGFIAFLMLSEMFTSNLFSLIGPLEATAEIMGVSVQTERLRLIILSVLDAIPGIGALLAVYSYRRTDSMRAGPVGVMMTTFGMLAYGVYQFGSATFQLGNMQGFVKLVGIVYALLGLAAWFIGSDLRKGQLSQETSTQAPV